MTDTSGLIPDVHLDSATRQVTFHTCKGSSDMLHSANWRVGKSTWSRGPTDFGVKTYLLVCVSGASLDFAGAKILSSSF